MSALWVRVDSTGRAYYGGAMPLPEIPAALRFLADHIESLVPQETPPTTS